MGARKMLTERQELILKTIIMDFTQTHEPVGSKTVTNQLPVKVSSATIRNEMAALEEQGLIEKLTLLVEGFHLVLVIGIIWII